MARAARNAAFSMQQVLNPETEKNQKLASSMATQTGTPALHAAGENKSITKPVKCDKDSSAIYADENAFVAMKPLTKPEPVQMCTDLRRATKQDNELSAAMIEELHEKQRRQRLSDAKAALK